MKARCIEYSELRAVVLLTPSWLARAFGARPVVVELERSASDLRLGYLKDWVDNRSGRSLHSLGYRGIITDALTYQEVDDVEPGYPLALPPCRVVRE